MTTLKSTIIIALASTLLISCGSSSKEEETVKTDSLSAIAEKPVESKSINPNLSITLNETSLEKVGLKIGLPEGWTVEESGFASMVGYQIKRGGNGILDIDSDLEAKEVKSLNDLKSNWEGDNILLTEENVNGENLVRNGIVINVKEPTSPERDILFDYFFSFPNGKVNFAKVHASANTYNSASIDTCIAIVKSIKSLK